MEHSIRIGAADPDGLDGDNPLFIEPFDEITRVGRLDFAVS